jgi:hypothetical protein
VNQVVVVGALAPASMGLLFSPSDHDPATDLCTRGIIVLE